MRLIFVHLGTSEAPHLWLNIRKISSDFPHIPITLLLTHRFPESSRFKKIANIEILDEDNLSESVNFELSHDLDFRNGFWKYTLLRFQAIADWHQNNPDQAVLHVESDVLLTPNFPFEKFTNLQKLYWANVNDSHDAPTLLYFPNKHSSKWLAKQILDEIRDANHLTDMTVLYKIRTKNIDTISLLPTIPQENRNGTQNETNFGGIFDAARVGMWLTGQDPRNHLGCLIRHHSLLDSEVNPKDWIFRSDRYGNLSGSCDGNSFPIFNLHVHSKRRSLFSNKSSNSIAFDVFLSRFKREIHTFKARIFCQMLFRYSRNNGIFSRQTVVHLQDRLPQSFRRD